LIEVLGTPDGTLYYRVFGRGDAGHSRVVASGPLKRGKDIVAFGGQANMPMTLTFRVDDYMTKGRERQVCVPINLPKGQMGNGLAASLVALTVDGHTEEFWIRRPAGFDPEFQP